MVAVEAVAGGAGVALKRVGPGVGGLGQRRGGDGGGGEGLPQGGTRPAENIIGKAGIVVGSWKPGISLIKPWTWLNQRGDRFLKRVR